MKNNKREYKMTVAGQLFQHLGLQMYSGAVPAISELISNSYDAMARNVWIAIPTGSPIKEEDKIEVKDDGHGMTFDECNSFYLSVGRNRRSGTGALTDSYNSLEPRKAQGRKGIGKLAGFGIAERVSIRTVRGKEISHFQMDFEKLTESSNFADVKGYSPKKLSDDGKNTDEDPETIVTLSRLKITRAIDEAKFRTSIARRLLVLNEEFTVHVNGGPISRKEIPLQFRFPRNHGDWEYETLEEGEEFKFRWWAGFSENTIPDEESRGFVIYVRGKLAQTPWFFDLSGGVWGQHGLQYLTGEVEADFLDESVDLIATGRAAVRWEEPVAAPLKEWGRKKVKELLGEWSEQRRKAKIESPKIKALLEQAEKLPKRDKKIFIKVVDRICAIPQLDKDEEGKEIADDLVEFAYNALTNRSFLNAIKQLNSASHEDIKKFDEVLSEWDVIEAVNTAYLVKGRREIIHKFKQMIDDKAPEKPDMQNYLKDHPWLINPKWSMLKHEARLDTIVQEYIEEGTASEGGMRRVDFFCLGDSQTAYIVEVKRPGASVGKNEIRQLEDYVSHLQNDLQQQSTSSSHRIAVVSGLLIAEKIQPEGQQHMDKLKEGFLEFRTWKNLMFEADNLHRELFQHIKDRAPQDDPRIKDLSEVNDEKT